MGLRQDPWLSPHIPCSKSPSRPLLAMGQAPIQGSPEAQSPEVLPLSLAHTLLLESWGPHEAPRPGCLTIWGLLPALPVVGTRQPWAHRCLRSLSPSQPRSQALAGPHPPAHGHPHKASAPS